MAEHRTQPLGLLSCDRHGFPLTDKLCCSCEATASAFLTNCVDHAFLLRVSVYRKFTDCDLTDDDTPYLPACFDEFGKTNIVEL